MAYFFSTRALAKHIGVSPQTILNWIDAGLLRPSDTVPYIGTKVTFFHIWDPKEINKAKKLKGKLKAGRPPKKKKSKKRGERTMRKAERKMLEYIQRHKCQECPRIAYSKSTWFVQNAIWKAAGYKGGDVACRTCLKKRLRKKFGIKERSYYAVLDAASKAIQKKAA